MNIIKQKLNHRHREETWLPVAGKAEGQERNGGLRHTSYNVSNK